MNIWRFTDPRNDGYASAGRRGSWTDADGGTCSGCSASRQERVRPLLMVWEPGSDVVGDFVWPGFGSEVVVTNPVLDVLSPRFTGFTVGPVHVVDESGLVTRSGPRVSLPYSGPPLHELWTTTWADADRQRSTLELERTCAICGTEFWHVDGVEHWNSRFDASEGRLVRNRVGRVAGRGVYVSADQLDGADIFRVRQLPGWVMCTDSVRDVIRERGFSNVDLLQLGELT